MAATGTPTPNIGLRIPLGTDPASVDDINYNSNLIDTKLGAVGNDSVQDQINDLNSKITNHDYTFSNYDLYVNCRNGVVYIRTGDNCDDSALANVTIPSAYRAFYNAGYPCSYFNGSVYINGFINVGTDGKLSLKDSGYSAATSNHIRACITYVP